MKSLLTLFCGLVLAFVLAFSSSAEAARGRDFQRLRRSVNFTPSWGKRSGNLDVGGGLQPSQGGHCEDRALYLELLMDTVKVLTL